MNNNTKTLCICIPAKNSEATLELCLNSVVDKRYVDDIECILVNDGSTDSTSSIAEAFAEKNPDTFIIINNSECKGVGAAYNACFKQMSARYVMTLDSDDYLNADELYLFISELKKCNSDIINFRQNLFGEINKTPEYISDVEFNREYTVNEVQDKIIFSIHNIAFSTELIKQNSIFADEHYFQYADIVLMARTVPFINTVTFCNYIIYNWRTSNNQSVSLSGLKKYSKSITGMVESLLIHYNSLKDDNSPIIVAIIKKMCLTHIPTAFYVSLITNDFDTIKNLTKTIKENNLYSEMPVVVKLISKNYTLVNFILAKLYVVTKRA